jgi:hypothetical protein
MSSSHTPVDASAVVIDPLKSDVSVSSAFVQTSPKGRIVPFCQHSERVKIDFFRTMAAESLGGMPVMDGGFLFVLPESQNGKLKVLRLRKRSEEAA